MYPRTEVTDPSVPTRDKGGQVGVRYITEDLIRKLTKQDRLEVVTTLSLTLSKDAGKKIKYIENLGRLKQLVVLNLSGNRIEKLEKLEHLVKLRELNVSHNQIGRIEAIETLTSLQVLNLTGNQIEHIPVWLGKKLKALQVFKIAKNRIQSLQECSRLRPLKDLSELSIAENPVCQLPHCRSFLVFHLRSVNTLDGQLVSSDERTDAHSRFAQKELEVLMQQLEQHQQEFQQLRSAHDESLHEVAAQETHARGMEQRLRERSQLIEELQRELNTKNDLLRRKTAQLTAACQKHYELEQEVAFYKIDHKFTTLARPKITTPDGSEGAEDTVPGESSYFGKGRFRQNEFAHERPVAPPQAVPAVLHQHGPEQSHAAMLAADEMNRMHAVLDSELTEKQQAIDQAQERLELLQEELASTEEQMTRATEELQKMSLSLTENDKQEIRNTLANKINMVHKLRNDANRIEAKMSATQTEIQTQEKSIGQLYGKLRRMASNDSLYKVVQKEVDEKEHQLDVTSQQYSDLLNRLHMMLATIARETNEIKKLEQELHEGQAVQNDEIREELQSIVHGLQTYMTTVQERAACEQQHCDELTRECEELRLHVRHLEDERQVADAQADELNSLKMEVNELRTCLEEQQSLNESQQCQLNENRLRQLEDANISALLNDVQRDNEHLRRLINETDLRNQADRDAYEKQLGDKDRQLSLLKEKTRLLNSKEDDIQNLHKQLADIQKANVHLQDKLYAEQQRLAHERSRRVDPTTLQQRLDAVSEAIRSGHLGQLPRVDAAVGEDELEAALETLQENVQDKLNKSVWEVEQAQQQRDQAEAAVHVLREEFENQQQYQRQMAETAIQTVVDRERQEIERLRDEVEQLNADLERERELSREKPLPVRLLQPSKQESIVSGTTTTTDTTSASTTTSSLGSSQWSQRRRDMYAAMTADEQELFTELQDEIEELRKLLSLHDQNVVDKAAQAEQTAARLQDMISKRHEKATGRSTAAQATSSSSSITEASRLAELGRELEKAQQEITTLQHKLLHDGIDGVAADVMAGKLVSPSNRAETRQVGKRKMDRLHNTIEKQRSKIEELSDQLEQADSLAPAAERRKIERLQETIEDQQTEIQQLKDQLSQMNGLASGDHMRPYDGATSSASYGPMGVASSYQYTSDRHQQPEQNGSQGYTMHSEDQYSSGRPATVRTHNTRGRPVPTFYDATGRTVPAPQPYYAPAAMPVESGTGGISAFHRHIPAHNIDAANQPAETGYHTMDGGTHPHAHPLPPGTGANVYYSDMIPVTPHGTTPIAGHSGNQVTFVPTTPVDHNTQPVMFSTPVSPQRESPVKGILKKSGVVPQETADQLMCNVPEHHQLEDYVEKLRERIRCMKKQQGDVLETAHTTEKSRKVLFEDDFEHEAIKHLQFELEERRAELEGLDLAVDRQRSKLQNIRATEHQLLSEREEMHRQLAAIRKNGNRHQTDRAFHDGRSSVPVDASRRRYGDRQQHVMDEVACVEETLAHRRAELREADRLLLQCQADQATARAEAELTVRQWEEARAGLESALEAVSQMEQKRQTAEHRLDTVHGELKMKETTLTNLQSSTDQQKETLHQIDMVIACKDEQFQKLEANLKQSTQRLQELGSELVKAESELSKKDALIEESNRIMQDRKKELNNLEEKVLHGQSELESMNHNCGQRRVELQLLDETLARRHQQLESVGHDVEREITNKRRDIKNVEDELEEIKKRKQILDVEYQSRQQRLEQEWQDLERVRSERRTAETELTHAQQQVLQTQDSLRQVAGRRAALETAVSRLQMEKTQLEEGNAKIQSRVHTLKQSEEDVEGNVHSQQLKLERLRAELQQIELALSDGRSERDALNSRLNGAAADTQGRSAQLNHLREMLGSDEQVDSLEEAEAEQREHTVQNFTSLEDKVRKLVSENSRHGSEKEKLRCSLQQSHDHLKAVQMDSAKEREEMNKQIVELETEVTNLKHDLDNRVKELREFRDKTAHDMAELESIAQAHCNRANRLGDELNYVQTDYLEVKRQFELQKDAMKKEQKLEETLQEIKTDIASGLSESLLELGKSREMTEAELDKMHHQKKHLEKHLKVVKQNLLLIRQDADGSCTDINVNDYSNSFLQQQNLLKKQLHQKMSRHAEVMLSQRQLSENNLKHLQRKLASLEQVRSIGDCRHVSAAEIIPSDLNRPQNLASSAKDESGLPPRAYSPHRHSKHRPRISPVLSVAERGPSS